VDGIQQGLRVHGLAKKTGGSCRAGGNSDFRRIMRGEKNQREIRAGGVESFLQFDSIHSGQGHVRDDAACLLKITGIQEILRGSVGLPSESVGRHDAPERPADTWVVVDDDDGGGGKRHGTARRLSRFGNHGYWTMVQ
jgi:hypothetical protein